MNDIENQVYTRIAQEFRARYPTGSISGVYVRAPSAFPHVCVEQKDSFAMVLDSSGHEITALMFEINVYSNSVNGKKTECKEIMRFIDLLMNSMNFVRTSLNATPNLGGGSFGGANLEEMEIYRLTARYSGATDGVNLFRR